KGIEVGHVFKLGYKYSEAMKATFLDEQGKDRIIFMGCYGIGVSRVVAACIEQNHDGGGIAFPPALAPFEAAVLCLDTKGEPLAKAEEIYAWLNAQGIEAVLDDRDERPGVKFKDADLIGYPMQLVIGGKGLGRGVVEVKDRRTGEKAELPVEGFQEAFMTWREKVAEGWAGR
ncbi:MAG: His/Gly/Thr/Pro-type tRNA ligase C-terminal domain-containing protein, partial [Acidobacteriota bacterium]